MAGLILPSNTASLIIGGRSFTDLQNLVTLTGTIQNSTNVYSGLSKFTPTGSQYQVPSGKTLFIQALRAFQMTATGGFLRLYYTDNGIGIGPCSTLGTNPVYNGGTGNCYTLQTPNSSGGQAEQAVDFQVPSSKYPNLFGSGDMMVMLFGYER